MHNIYRGAIIPSMIKEMLRGADALRAITSQNPHGLVIMEGPTNCNRACSYCTVPQRWNPEEASTVTQTNRQTDWQYGQGYRVLNYVGGESLAECPREGAIISGKYRICEYGLTCGAEDPDNPIVRAKEAPFRTKEEITFAEHAIKVIEHASGIGMLTNVTTNGDFLKPANLDILRKLKLAGLTILTLSLHSVNDAGLKNIVGKARAAAQEGLIPVVSVVFTADRTETIPQYARICAANGIIFSTSIVQEIGGGFSAVPTESQIPSIEQQRYVFGNLLPLKRAGFILNNLRYLTEAVNFSGNSWRCNPEKDLFIHIRAKGEKGEIGVCPDVRTDFHTGEIDLHSEAWREEKRNLVRQCRGCLYSCYFQSENTDFKGDLRTLMNMILIKSGHADIVRRLGKHAVGRTPGMIPIPQSRLERAQAEIKDYYKLHNEVKRRMSDLKNTLAMPFVALAVSSAFLAMLSWDVVKERINPHKGN